jgi:hypothetical protein
MRWSIRKNGTPWGCALGNCHAAVDFILRSYEGAAGGSVAPGRGCMWLHVYNDEYQIKIIDKEL